MGSETGIFTHIVYTDPSTCQEHVLQSIAGQHDFPAGTLVVAGAYRYQVTRSEVVLGAPAILKVHVE